MSRKNSYSFGKIVSLSHADAVVTVKQALAEQGFGILSEIDVAAKFKEKLGIDYRPYLILGACNPKLARRALDAEPDLGVLLPCNVIVYVDREGQTNVMAMDPEGAMAMVEKPAVGEVAHEVRNLLAKALEKLP